MFAFLESRDSTGPLTYGIFMRIAMERKVDELAPIFAMVNLSVKTSRSDSSWQLFGDSGSDVSWGEGGDAFEKKSLLFF